MYAIRSYYVVEPGHHLTALDDVGQIRVDLLDPAAHLGGDHELRKGLQGAGKGAAQLDRTLLDGGHLDRDRAVFVALPLGLAAGLPLQAFVDLPADQAGDEQQGEEDIPSYNFV